jgi:hypothetical protein
MTLAMMIPNDFDDVREYPHFRREVLFSVSDHIEKYGAGLFDVSVLPFEKDVILYAHLVEIALNPNNEEVALYAVGATLLANFQPGIGKKGYSSAEVKKIMSAPLFKSGEVSENDIAKMNKQLKIIEILGISSEERQDIYRQTQNARYLNNALQHPVERMRRTAWRIIRPCLYAILFGFVLIMSLPLITLSLERRNRILASPTKWINWLGKKPKYEWDHLPINLK